MTNENKEKIEVFTNELPTLHLERSRTINDFEVERVAFHASGVTIEEAQKGMMFLLDISDHNVKRGGG